MGFNWRKDAEHVGNISVDKAGLNGIPRNSGIIEKLGRSFDVCQMTIGYFDNLRHSRSRAPNIHSLSRFMHQRTHHCDDKERKMNPKLPHEAFSIFLVLRIFCFMQIHAQRNPTNQCKVILTCWFPSGGLKNTLVGKNHLLLLMAEILHHLRCMKP